MMLWIGDNQHPEFRDAWTWASQSGQCQHRGSIDDAVEQPVARSTPRIVIARPDRQPLPAAAFNALQQQYPLASYATLLGSLCEGEQRTGTPWPHCQRIYWHRWSFQLVAWSGLNPQASPSAPTTSGCIGIVSRSRWIGSGVVDSLRHANIPCVAVALQQLAIAGPYSDLLWDDSVIATLDDWQAQAAAVAAHAGTARHHWLVSSPRVETWHALQAAGFESLHSKPLDLDSILASLNRRTATA
ncbi:hypothetical protein [Rosistilla oblonga]|uniref:hypothetical protein n=1 Tax=Rosistilla oblonga TaxID=2527990 RepID=UPI003A984074